MKAASEREKEYLWCRNLAAIAINKCYGKIWERYLTIGYQVQGNLLPGVPGKLPFNLENEGWHIQEERIWCSCHDAAVARLDISEPTRSMLALSIMLCYSTYSIVSQRSTVLTDKNGMLPVPDSCKGWQTILWAVTSSEYDWKLNTRLFCR